MSKFPSAASARFEIAVFAKGSRTDRIASERVDYESALEMVRFGVAKWVNNRRNSIVMLIEPQTLSLNDQSCQMGPNVIEGNADGQPNYVALTNHWAPILIGRVA